MQVAPFATQGYPNRRVYLFQDNNSGHFRYVVAHTL